MDSGEPVPLTRPPVTVEGSLPFLDGLLVCVTSFLTDIPKKTFLLSKYNLRFPSYLRGDKIPFNEKRVP